MKLSIIIPVYKVEKYVEKCLKSCINQDIDSSEYEIIVINDGSPDSSIEIVNSIAIKYHNIKIISQINQGLSVARNEGLKLATGEYIWFVDSDDWIAENCLFELYNICTKNNLDILSIDLVQNTLKTNPLTKTTLSSITSGKSYLNRNINFTAWSYIFKKKFLIENNLFFMPNIYHEDNEFIPRALYFAKYFMKCNIKAYNVFSNPESITRSINPKKAFDLLKVAQSHVDFLNSQIRGGQTVFYYFIGLAINSALANTKQMNPIDKNQFRTELYNKKRLFQYMKKSTKTKYKLEGYLYLLSPNLFFTLYNLVCKYK